MKPQFFHLSQKHFNSYRLSQIIIVVGILLRWNHYVQNRSFWLDEAWLALDITVRSFSQILTLTAFSADLPVAPMGFVLIEKCAIVLLGNYEWTLRLFPFLCSVLSLVLFYMLLKKFLSPSIIPWTLGLFALCDPLILYAGELKQYQSDVFVTLILYLGTLHFMDRRLSFRDIIMLGILGVAAISLSYTAVFVLAAIAIVQLASAYRQKDWERARELCSVYYFWGICFLIYYIVSIRHMSANPVIAQGGGRHFIPQPFWSGDAVLWLMRSHPIILYESVGTDLPYLFGNLLLLGAYELYKTSRKKFFLLTIPLALAVIGSAANRYPLAGRFLLFGVPAMLILVTLGIEWLRKSRFLVFRITAGCVIVLLLIHPTLTARYYLRHDRKITDNRTIIQFLKQYQRPGDALYLNHSAQYAYAYYLGPDGYHYRILPIQIISDEVFNNREGKYILRQDVIYKYTSRGFLAGIREQGETQRIYDRQLNAFGANPRTWIVLSHATPQLRNFTEDVLKRQGRILQMNEGKGTVIYFYDLSFSSSE